MGNKFTQSVLQRLEQEQKLQPSLKKQTKTVTKKPNETKSVENIVMEKKSTEPINLPDVTEYLRVEPARSAKNKTFYLDIEVIEALCSAARRQNVTDSKLCNDILRRVLGIGGANG